MKLTKLILTAGALLASTSLFATPQYIDKTTSASDLVGGNAGGTGSAGYYIWNEEAATDQWHIRWTSDNASTDSIIDWFGNIVFHNSALDSTSSYLFENGGTYGDTLNVSYDNWLTGEDEFGWAAHTNDIGGVDGIDFVIGGNLELLEFNLGTSLYNIDSSDVCLLDSCASEASFVYIGEDLAAPDVLQFITPNGRTVQTFEVAVPEPSIIALFGLGLIGMGFVGRRRKS
jgi:hypothetical protein